jgi:hypothetical protein
VKAFAAGRCKYLSWWATWWAGATWRGRGRLGGRLDGRGLVKGLKGGQVHVGGGKQREPRSFRNPWPGQGLRETRHVRVRAGQGAGVGALGAGEAACRTVDDESSNTRQGLNDSGAHRGPTTHVQVSGELRAFPPQARCPTTAQLLPCPQLWRGMQLVGVACNWWGMRNSPSLGGRVPGAVVHCPRCPGVVEDAWRMLGGGGCLVVEDAWRMLGGCLHVAVLWPATQVCARP